MKGNCAGCPPQKENEKHRLVTDVRLMKQEGHLIPHPEGGGLRVTLTGTWHLGRRSYMKLYLSHCACSGMEGLEGLVPKVRTPPDPGDLISEAELS